MTLFRFAVFAIVFVIAWWPVRFILAVITAVALTASGAYFPEHIETYRQARVAIDVLDVTISLALASLTYRVIAQRT